MSSDRIEKSVVLQAPLERVWRAVSDADEFGRWFGVRFDGPFVAGTTVSGVMTPTAVDEAVAKEQEAYEGEADDWHIVAVEPMRRFAFRWHPYALDPDADPAAEPTTLVEFTLAEVDGGVLLRIVESGFDAIPADRRVSAFEGNSEGWQIQTRLISRYLAVGETV